MIHNIGNKIHPFSLLVIVIFFCYNNSHFGGISMAVSFTQEHYKNLLREADRIFSGSEGMLLSQDNQLLYKIWYRFQDPDLAYTFRKKMDKIACMKKQRDNMNPADPFLLYSGFPLDGIYINFRPAGMIQTHFDKAQSVSQLLETPIPLEKKKQYAADFVYQLKTLHHLGYIRGDIHISNELISDQHGHLIDLDSCVFADGDRNEARTRYGIRLDQQYQKESFQTDNLKEIISCFSLLYQLDFEKLLNTHLIDFDDFSSLLKKGISQPLIHTYLAEVKQNKTTQQVYFDAILPLFDDEEKVKVESKKLKKLF